MTRPLSLPHEAAPMQAIWTAFPSHADLWQENLIPAQAEVAALARTLAAAGPVKILVMGSEAHSAAHRLCSHANITLVPAQYGDIWLRDTGPIFAHVNGVKKALRFKNNGWGGKYQLPFDDIVGDTVAIASGTPIVHHDYVLEGGALEFDGAGAVITTRECLLNPNRNGPVTESEVTARLMRDFGLSRVIWLDSGLVNDHTDGHVDNLARFIAPGHALCQSPFGKDDPNTAAFAQTQAALRAAGLRVSTIVSPGLVTNEDDEPVAASHMNYIIYNGIIVLPVYNTEAGEQARAQLSALFPHHRVIALPARAILTGGGSFHCITQQEIMP